MQGINICSQASRPNNLPNFCLTACIQIYLPHMVLDFLQKKCNVPKVFWQTHSEKDVLSTCNMKVCKARSYAGRRILLFETMLSQNMVEYESVEIRRLCRSAYYLFDTICNVVWWSMKARSYAGLHIPPVPSTPSAPSPLHRGAIVAKKTLSQICILQER